MAEALELLKRHINRAQPHASNFRRRVQDLYNEYHPPYDPAIGWDTMFKPKIEGQAYVPVPLVWVTVNVMSALMGMRPPIIKMEPKTSDPQDRNNAAEAELLLRYEFQRQGMKETHLDLAKVLSFKGRAAVKVGYQGKEIWTDNIDMPENLWAEWSSDSYKQVRSWSYHSLINPDEAKEVYGWGGSKSGTFWELMSNLWNFTHDDFLGRKSLTTRNIVPIDDYVPMVDFHYRLGDKIMNAIIIGNEVVEDRDTGLPDFPYIVVNCDTEPGNPFGIGDAEPVVGLQKELSTRLTAWAEAIRRNGQDQWVTYNLRGLNPIEMEGGGRYFPLGAREEEGIDPLKYPIDNLGFSEYIKEVLDIYRRVSGLPEEVVGGGSIAAATSGYAMAVRFQAVVTRLGPRQIRLESFYQTWAALVLKINEKVEKRAKELIDGNYFTSIDFESITPRDFRETVVSLATAVQANILSRRTAIEELNKVSEDEFEYMREENSDPALSPETAAAIQAIIGKQSAIQQGNPATIAGAQQQTANEATPPQTFENQHTAPPNAPANPAASAASTVGVQPPQM